MQRLGILVIGDEILSARRRDRHFAHAVEFLGARGLRLAWARFAGDAVALLTMTLREIRASGDICFSFGGIGATPDDLTRPCVADAYEVPLVRHPEAAAEIEAQFGAAAYPNRVLMADLPRGADLIPNPVNRIPGFSIGDLHCLPGFPHMAWPMMEWVLDRRYAQLQASRSHELAVTVYQAHESDLLGAMREVLERHPEVKVFSLPHFLADGGQEVELGVKGEPERARAAFDDLQATLERLGYRDREQSD